MLELARASVVASARASPSFAFGMGRFAEDDAWFFAAAGAGAGQWSVTRGPRRCLRGQRRRRDDGTDSEDAPRASARSRTRQHHGLAQVTGDFLVSYGPLAAIAAGCP